MDKPDCFWSRVLSTEAQNIKCLLEMEKALFQGDAVTPFTLVPLVTYQRAYLYQDTKGNHLGYALVLNHSQLVDKAYLFSYGILPQYQGQGLGRLGFMELSQILKQEGFDNLELTVSPDNAGALRIYRLLPVLKETYLKNHYGENQDRICLILKLGNIFNNPS